MAKVPEDAIRAGYRPHKRAVDEDMMFSYEYQAREKKRNNQKLDDSYSIYRPIGSASRLPTDSPAAGPSRII